MQSVHVYLALNGMEYQFIVTYVSKLCSISIHIHYTESELKDCIPIEKLFNCVVFTA